MIHPTAIVDPAARIGNNVTIGPYSIVGPGVEIGDDNWIGPHVVLSGPMMIGQGNRIFQFASLGEISQDKSARPEDDTRVEIGNGNTIREYVTIQRGTLKAEALTRVGDDNWIMAQAHIAHDCFVGDHTILANGTTLAGHVTIEDWAALGGYTLVHQICRVGAHAFSGGGAVILRDLPPHVMSEGQPAAPRGINKEGLRRRGFTPDQIDEVEDIYKLVYRSGKLIAAIKDELRLRAEHSPISAQWLEFIEKSKRALQR